jgi:hypothetical protein
MEKLYVQEPWFSLIRSGSKTVEGRKGTLEDFKNFKNTFILIKQSLTLDATGQVVNPNEYLDSFEVFCYDIVHYKDVDSYLWGEGIRQAAPHCTSFAHAQDLYSGVVKPSGEQVFAPIDVQRRGGICALRLVVTTQKKL